MKKKRRHSTLLSYMLKYKGNGVTDKIKTKKRLISLGNVYLVPC